MIGPVLERIEYELARLQSSNESSQLCLGPEFCLLHLQRLPDRISTLSTYQCSLTAQLAAATSGIETNSPDRQEAWSESIRRVMDNIDVDFAIEKYSTLMNNDPKMIRSPEEVQKIRVYGKQAQAAQQQAMQAEQASQLAAGAKTLSETDLGGGKSALQQMMGGGEMSYQLE